jgi:hypothetical protein
MPLREADAELRGDPLTVCSEAPAARWWHPSTMSAECPKWTYAAVEAARLNIASAAGVRCAEYRLSPAPSSACTTAGIHPAAPVRAFSHRTAYLGRERRGSVIS